MSVLIACEFSGRVRDAFLERGHEAWSCDLLPSKGPHIQGDVLDVIDWGWDMMIAHPPCTHLAVSGARWFKDKEKEQEEALEFVRLLMNAPINKICIENPVSIISTRIRKPDQYIQPYEYGDRARKKTCLWLKNLPPLKPTNIVEPELVIYNGKSYSADYGWSTNKKGRQTTYKGIANAMAEQWSN